MQYFVHPAVGRLLSMQMVARLRRTRRAFITRRRLWLSCLGVALAFVYLGNIVVSVVMREPMDPERFARLVPLGLLMYVLWDMVKLVWRRPEEAIAWTPAEIERLRAAPLRRWDMIAYRFATIAMAATLKAALFCIVMWSDLPVFWMGFLGAVMALAFVDLSRVASNITVHGLSDRAYRLFRAATFVTVTSAVVSAVVTVLASTRNSGPNVVASTVVFAKQIVGAAVELRETWVGVLLETPFLVFRNVIAGDATLGARILWALLAMLLVIGLGGLVPWLDRHVEKTLVRRERRRYGQMPDSDLQHRRGQEEPFLLSDISRWPPLAAIAWRQWRGANRYRGGLVLALVPPAVLSWLPLVVGGDRAQVYFAVVASVAFYSFLLLPAALKFDFRRDVERIAALKSLPLRPSTVVIGQLAVPVLIASMFQLCVIAVAALATRCYLGYIPLAMFVLIPLNVAIYALDNFLFLLYPHRLKQEGLEVFLRTTLVFTAKGMLFSIAVVFVIVWAFLATYIARSTPVDPLLAFGAGLVCLLTITAGTLLLLATCAYRRFNPCQDVPG